MSDLLCRKNAIVTIAEGTQSDFLQTVCLKELILARIQMADLEITIRSHAPSCCDADLSVGGRQICKYALLTRINRKNSAIEM